MHPFHSRLLLLLSGALAACGRGGEASGAQRPGGGGRAIPVAVAQVAPRDLSRSVVVAGPVEPVRTIGVNALLAGTVLAVRVQEGDRVKEGQLLAELDARETRAQFQRAQALLANAQTTFERNEQLVKSQIITDAEFQQSRSAYDVAKSDADVWRTRLAFTRIAAPSAGVVTAKHVEAGSAVSPNQRVFDLADISLLVVRVQVSERDVVHVQPGLAVTVAFDAYPDTPGTGTVRRVFPSANAESRLVPVEVALSRLPNDLVARPGFLARVTFHLDRRAGALSIPAPAIGMANEGAYVFVVDADSVVRRDVQLGVTAEGWVEVAQGLRAGEQVVTSGHTNLRSGTRVRVANNGVEE
ncbi:MAG TPA: efflux RND transporter periplasmic adaptor subunit [Gemmatimonadales bacterium]|nr:efflux RND transporter periplasmic adaptor subunit [Gemmatimonadales bacterium]